MAYFLTDDLLTGNTTIDSEHHQLFDAINKLLDACSSGHGRDQLGETMKFLEEYIAGWLMTHIKREDKKVAAHIKNS